MLNTCTYAAGDLPGDEDQDGVADPEDACPQSNMSPTVVIAGRDSGVANILLAGGCTISDKIAACSAAAAQNGAFMSCVVRLSSNLEEEGIITSDQKRALDVCAARTVQAREFKGHGWFIGTADRGNF